MRLAVPRIADRPWRVLATGVAAEAVLHLGLRIGEPYVRGLPGALSVAVAVFAALFAGALAGAVVALAGWVMFAAATAETFFAALVVLPVWVGVPYLVGLVAERLRDVQSERIRAHELHTPAATIAGMAASLRRYELDEAQRERLLALIEAEARRLVDQTEGTIEP